MTQCFRIAAAAGCAASALAAASLALAATQAPAPPPAKPAAASATATPATAAPAKPAISDKAAIERLERHYAAAFNARDVKTIMTFYTPGVFVFDVVPPRQYVGSAAYKKDWEGLLAAYPGPVTFKLTDLDVTVSGDVAFSHSIQAAEFTKADGTKVPLTVRVTDVYRKVNGKWLIVQEHVSVPVDLATMKPDPTSAP